MTWPHVLSFSRVLAGPIVALLILYKPGDADLVAAILFALASLTDLVDGKLARYSQQVSPLGIFIDTTSDKVLVSLALIAMAVSGMAQVWVALVIVGREFLISGLRSYAASCDRIISAHAWGKGKAAITMVAIIAVLVAVGGEHASAISTFIPRAGWSTFGTAAQWLLGVSAVLTIISGSRYVVDAWPLLRSEPAAVEEPRRIAAGGKR
jgi:CDP-diacylglycerol--glycerol-3-phosphate 3-phosphatidyltransferase